MLKGKVTRIADFGAFVDIGGVEGLVHISDLAWYRVVKPQDIVNVGKEVEVAILKVDAKAKKVSLSMKQMQRDPWFEAIEDFSEGMKVFCQVIKLAKFGAFVLLRQGIEGLIPLSELADKKIASAKKICCQEEKSLIDL